MNTFNLLGEIVADDSQKWFPSDVVPAMVIGWLAKQDGDVEININSPGGDVTAGLAIANAIKGYDKGKVTANVLGIAASMASVIACACDDVKMGKGAFVMIHNPWGVAVGEAEELRHQADVMDKMKASIIGFYQSKFSKTPEELAGLMDAETWIAAEEAESFGFSAQPFTEEFKVAACATRRALDHAPDAAKAFFAVREKPAEQAAQASAAQGENWEARYKGAMRAMSEKADAITKLTNDLAEASNTIKARNATIAERDNMIALRDAKIKDFETQLGAVRHDLEEANAKLSGMTERAEKAEKDLAAKGERISQLEKAHALLTAGVLSPGGEAEPADSSKGKTPEEREKIRKEIKKNKKS